MWKRTVWETNVINWGEFAHSLEKDPQNIEWQHGVNGIQIIYSQRERDGWKQCVIFMPQKPLNFAQVWVRMLFVNTGHHK